MYEVHDFHHAAAILKNEFPTEFAEICRALLDFKITVADIKAAGGNESRMPKKFRTLLSEANWQEQNLKAVVVVDERQVKEATHKIDFVCGRVAVDFEWNSKDQTFDRDLFALSAFFEYDKISVGVLVTRSNDLDVLFPALGFVTDSHGVTRLVRSKYGPSTTHMGKLLPRLESGRNGGCPILVFGITRAIVTDVPAIGRGKAERTKSKGKRNK